MAALVLWWWLTAVALINGVVDGGECNIRGTMVWGYNAFTNEATRETFVYPKSWPAYNPCGCNDSPIDYYTYNVNVWYWTPTLTAPYAIDTCK